MFGESELNIGIYCSSTDWGWTEQHSMEYAVWLKERGAKVVLFCVDDSPLYREGKNQRLRVERIQKNKKYGDRKNARKIAVKFENNKLDVIWISDKWDISVAGLAKGLSKRKLILVYQQNSEISSNKKDFVHSRRYAKIDIWLSPLKSLSDQVKARTKFHEDKVHVVPTGINVQNLMYHNISKEQARFELNVDSSALILGVSGKISPRRGQLFITMALAEIQRFHPGVKLIICGKKGRGDAESYYDDLVEVVEKYRLSDSVYIREETENEALFYRAIDIFVCANKEEVAGIETIKAMLFGCNIIGVNSGGVPELLEWGEYGELFGHDDPFEFSQAFDSMQVDELAADKKARRAAEHAKDHYDHYYTCSIIENLIKERLKANKN